MSDDENNNDKTYDWSALYDAEGNIYYHNERTDETTWELPEGEKFNPPEKDFEEIKAKENEGSWEKHVDDDSGNVFYYHTGTEVTTWERPDGYQSEGEADDEMDVKQEEDEKKEESTNNDNKEDPSDQQVKQEEPEDEGPPLPSSPIGGPDGDDEEDEEKLPSSPIGGPDDDDDDEDDNPNAEEEPRRAGDWVEHEDDTGNKYYHNEKTDETTWDRPPEFDQMATDGEDEKRAGLSSPKHGLDEDDGDGNQQDKDDEEPRRAGDWLEHEDDEGNKYYHNEKTGETTWDRPEEFDKLDSSGDAAAEPLSSPKHGLDESNNKEEEEGEPRRAGDWLEHEDDEGRKYYHNLVTDEVTWERPEEFDKLDSGDDKAALASSAPIDGQPSKAGKWEKLIDPETGREYYYNGEVTQWEEPDDFEETADDVKDEPMSGISPQRSPSPMEMEEEKQAKEEEKEPEPEIDPAVKKVKDAEEALNKPDSVMEPGTCLLFKLLFWLAEAE